MFHLKLIFDKDNDKLIYDPFSLTKFMDLICKAMDMDKIF